MQMHLVNIIDIFRSTVSGMPHIADHIARRNQTSLCKSFRIGIILAQVGVVVIPLLVKAADAQPPAPVLVPANCFYVSGFDGNDWSADVDIIFTFL